jgi:hypothetical protein
VQTDAEHQQHDTDLGELGGKLGIGHESGRGGSNHDAGNQIPHQSRQLEADRDKAHDQRQS